MKKSYNIIFPVALSMCFAPMARAQEADTTEAADSLSGQVKLAFRTSDASDILGGVSTIDITELNEKSYTTGSLDNMQGLVTGYNGQLWDMGDVVVLVDGVPRDASNIVPQEIESITFLKGAQAVVLYGSIASKGAVLINTKRGVQSNLQVSVRGTATLNVPKSYTKYLGSAEYMTLYNEARANDGLAPAFSAEDIYRYGSGENPWRYPDINFFSEDYVKSHYMKYEGQAEFRGGGKYAQYFAMVGLNHTNSIMNFGEGKKNGTTRLYARGNIDLTLNDWVTGWVNTSATFWDNRYDNSNFWSESATLRPTEPGSNPLVPLIPIDAIEENDANSWILVNGSKYLVDGKYLLGGTQNHQTNPFAAMYAAGYTKQTIRQMQFDAGVRINLAKLVDGLSFVVRGAVDYNTQYLTSVSNQYAVYQANWTNYGGKDVIESLTKYGVDKSTGTQNVSSSIEKQTMMFSGQFDYKRSFGDLHNIDANLVAHMYKRSWSGVYHNETNASLALRAAYNYGHRYYAEFNGALNHASIFAPGKRDGFSPVGTIGWRISQEEWLKDSPVVDELAINATYGQILETTDITGYIGDADFDKKFYLWTTKYNPAGNYWGWSDASSLQKYSSQQGANKDLTFVKRREFNVGVNGALWNRALTFQANFFNDCIDGLPVRATNFYPSYLGTEWSESSFVPWINYNKQRVTGFDLGAAGKVRFDKVEVQLGANVMYAYRKNIRVSETPEYDWLRQEGENTNALRGYHCLGFFQTEEEVASSAKINNETTVGDLKYEDLNGDGIIDSRDQQILGSWTAPWTYGVNLTVKYSGFTLYVNGSGNAGGTGVMNDMSAWVYGDRKYSEIVRGRWTKETAATATYPRLTTKGGDLNFVTSDFWTYSTDAFYINQIQLTYDFPNRLFANKFVKGIQLYANANGLLMIGPNRKYRETNVGYNPQTRSFDFGVKVNF